MTDNILKKHVERTEKELVAEVYPADKPYRDLADKKDVKRGKKYYEAAEHVLNALVAGSTTLVSDMSLSLADNASADEMKNAQEQLSGWLQRYDFETGLNDYLMAKAKPLVIRPYQLLCTICSMGADDTSSPHYAKAMRIREAIRKNPDIPVTLACHGGSLYSFQDSGSEDDTPESFEYNQKRDFDVLQILGLAPGSTLPARALFELLMKGLPSINGICGYGKVTGEAWKGCPMAETDHYEKGFTMGIKKLIAPRTEEEMAAEKAIVISTHILEEVDAVCTRAIIIANGEIRADGTPHELARMDSETGRLDVVFRKLTMRVEEDGNE